MSATITYKGSTLTTVSNDTKILNTAGKYMEADVVVTDVTQAPALEIKTATPSETAQVITPDSGYDGLAEVDVAAIPSNYVGTGITRRSSSDLTASGATVTAPAGYYASQASKSVASGTAGTPIVTKGTVSNHSVSVTPSVTNTTGYITGSTKTGTAVTVTASELVSGSQTITENGTVDVTNLASVTVDVESSPTYTATLIQDIGRRGQVYYNQQTYNPTTSTSLSFTFHAGDTCDIYSYGEMSGGTIYINGVSVGSSDASVKYTYTLPQNDIEFIFTDSRGVGACNINYIVPQPMHLITINGNGSSGNTDVKIVGSNISYYTNGDAIIFSEGDSLYVRSFGSRTNGVIYVNGQQVSGQTSSGSYTLELPPCDVSVELSYGTTGIVRITYTLPAVNITENGTYDVSNYAIANVNVSTGGGGGGSASPKQINFIDYDGTIVKSYTKTEWQSVTALPSNPSHSGLTAQGWNWTKVQIDAQLTAMPNDDVWVGQMYITDDGKTRIYIHLEKGRLHPYFGICPNGTVVIDWGDNSATTTLTGTSLTTVQTADHEYASASDYVITLTVSSGSFAFFGVSNTSYILRKNTTTTSNIHKVYANAVQKVELGSGATIGTYAFKYCSSLASITIPSGVTSIGDGAFYYCYALASITIPSNVTSIRSNAFNSCYSLASITIPSGVTSIEMYAFNTCYSLASITIPSNVTSIGSNAFTYCSSLASITIPSGVTSIGNSAFYYCYSLASITIPSNVTSIGSNAFTYCYSLTSITIPSGVTSVGTYMFSSCSSLASITIPSGVTSVGNYAFNSCYSLASITIPSDVTSIGNNVFSGCYGMAEYHIKPTTPPTLGKNVFQNIQSDCIIYVPSASLTAYQKATNWSTYASYMRGE